MNGSPCPSWTFEDSTCPVVPNCASSNSCASCALQSECAWCASDNVCTTISDAFSMDCRGLVFEPPCPESYVTDNVIVGNLIVKADPSFGGGQLNVSGSQLLYDRLHDYHVTMNATSFDVQSGGALQMMAGDTSEFNSIGGGPCLSTY